MAIKKSSKNDKAPRVNTKLDLEWLPLNSLKSHPRNYVEHPDDEIEHIIESIKEHGVYKNVVVARDNTILAGHGVVKALTKMGAKTVPVRRLNVMPDDPRALKVLVGDNEIRHLAMGDDRALTDMLKEIKDADLSGLLGTGYDEMMLANLVMVTRPASEIEGFDASAEWVGMPEYERSSRPYQTTVLFRNEKDVKRFYKLLNLPYESTVKTTWWPYKEKDDPSSLKFIQKEI